MEHRDAQIAHATQKGRHEGLARAHELVSEAFDRLTEEHKALSGDWLGRPRQRHQEIMAISLELKKLGHALFSEINKTADKATEIFNSRNIQ